MCIRDSPCVDQTACEHQGKLEALVEHLRHLVGVLPGELQQILQQTSGITGFGEVFDFFHWNGAAEGTTHQRDPRGGMQGLHNAAQTHPKPFTRSSLLAMAAGIGLSLSCVMQPLHAATEVALVSGAFRRSIPVKEIEHLAKTSDATGLLEDLLELSGQDPNEVAQMLNQSLELPLVLTSRLINTRIGEAILRRVARIIHPIYTPEPEVSVPAIRAGVISGLQSEEGLTAVSFLKGYPNAVMAVNLPALFGVVEKAESIAGLVQFFSDSPLDGLKEAQP